MLVKNFLDVFEFEAESMPIADPITPLFVAQIAPLIVGDLLGVFTLVLGVVIGFFLGRAFYHQSAAKTTDESQHLKEQLDGMIQLTNHFSGDLTKQIEMLEHLGKKLDAQPDAQDEDGDIGPKALQLITEVVASNQRLKNRLSSKEAELKSKAQALEQSASQARTDPLTGLANRRAFEETHRSKWGLWQRKGLPYCLLMIDIDHFKSINDQYGHDVGDQVLRVVAKRLSGAMRDTDYVARVGGEEFLILVPETEDQLAIVAQRVLNSVRSSPVQYADISIPVTVSCGVMSSTRTNQIEMLVKGADEALYAAKNGGRNRAYANLGNRMLPLERVSREASPHSIPPAVNAPAGSNAEEVVQGDLTEAIARLKSRVQSSSDAE